MTEKKTKKKEQNFPQIKKRTKTRHRKASSTVNEANGYFSNSELEQALHLAPMRIAGATKGSQGEVAHQQDCRAEPQNKSMSGIGKVPKSERCQRKRENSDSSDIGEPLMENCLDFSATQPRRTSSLILVVSARLANCYVHKKDEDYSKNDDAFVSGTTRT